LRHDFELRGQLFVERRKVRREGGPGGQGFHGHALGRQARQIGERICAKSLQRVQLQRKVRGDEVRQIHRGAGVDLAGKGRGVVQQLLRGQQQRVDLELIALDVLRESQYSQFLRCKRHSDLPSLVVLSD